MTSCEIIKDLLPLYKDEVVSASSIEMIEEHLKNCENCKAELDKLQGEVKVSFNPKQNAEIGAFRLFKKKLFRRNIVIACISAVLVVTLIFGTYIYLDNNTTLIPYTESLVVDVNAYPDSGIIDVLLSVKPESWNIGGMTINENGENVRLVFMDLGESVISKWQNNRSEGIEYSLRVVQPLMRFEQNPEDKPEAALSDNPIDRYEIYYINESLSEVNMERDYSKLRLEGNLLWSGPFPENVPRPDSIANELLNSYRTQLISYLSEVFSEAYEPFYDGLHYEMTNYEEKIFDGEYCATFFWTMYHFENGLEVSGDLGKEQEANWSLQATIQITADGQLDTTTAVILADNSPVGPPTYQEPIEDYFPNR
jgi:hypothetical protein